MILAKNILEKHPLIPLFTQLERLLGEAKIEQRTGRGRRPVFSHLQILKCVVYQVFYRIIGFRELEWRLRLDPIACSFIGLSTVPDHSTLSRRINQLEETLYYHLFQAILSCLLPDTRLCYWDSTALRSTPYDQDSDVGKSTRLGCFRGYKCHAIVSHDLIPLVWDVLPASFYDNQADYLLHHLEEHDIFLLLADAAYDDQKLFALAKEKGLRLVTNVNPRRATSPDQVTNRDRRENWMYAASALGKKMLRNRTKVEHLFALLKERYSLENPRIYGIKRYARHVGWVLFTYLIDFLATLEIGSSIYKAPWNR